VAQLVQKFAEMRIGMTVHAALGLFFVVPSKRNLQHALSTNVQPILRHILRHHREHRTQRGSGINCVVQTEMHTCSVLTCRDPTCHVGPLGRTDELGVHHKLWGCGVQTGAGVQVHIAFPGTSLVTYSSPFATCMLPFTHLLLCSDSASHLHRPTL